MNLWSVASRLNQEKKSFCVVTLINVIGSAPQDRGAKMIVTSEGLAWGTIGGGKVELASIKKAKELIDQKISDPLFLRWNLQIDIGMSCGGVVEILMETFINSKWPIVIFGAGHVSQALTRILKNLDCDLTCVDSREEWVNKLEGVTALCHSHPEELVSSFDPRSFFICMTMGHSYDVPILLEISKHASNSPYIGVIGSEIKGKKIKSELKELGVSENFLQTLRVPLGLPIGSNHPYEIAISISAELIQVRDNLNSLKKNI
jgi:xanthine dehydrogenase accessory factor